MPSSHSTPTSANLIEGISVKRHALGELVRSLLRAAEREEELYKELRVAHEEDNKESVMRLAGELLSLRPSSETKPENCTPASA